MAIKIVCGACGERFARGVRRVWIGTVPYHRACLARSKSSASVAAVAASETRAELTRVRAAGELSDVCLKPTMEIAVVLKTLQRCGEDKLLAQISYKKLGGERATDRTVEPYQFLSSGNQTMVECWQVTPAIASPAWRNFRVDRIVAASALPKKFMPRAPVTLHTGEVRDFVISGRNASAPEAPTPIGLYSNRLFAALADMELTEQELVQLRQLSSSLPKEQVRAVHGQFYLAALNEFCADGRMEDDEVERLTTIRIWLNELGWSP